MTKKTYSKTTKDTNEKVAEIVTQQVIKGLEQGDIPWTRPWSLAHGRYRNFATGHEYSGVNIILASMYCMANKWEYPLFASFKQISNLGAKVNKGSKGNIITFTKQVEYMRNVESENDNGELVESKQKSRYYMLRYYTVFNIDQVEFKSKLDRDKYIKKYCGTKPKPKTNGNAERLLHKHNPVINYGGDSAYYSPSSDYIQLPVRQDFKTQNDYYMTAYHELLHWSGHDSRLNRFDGKDLTIFGSDSYSFEELTAEIGSCMLGYQVGVIKEVTKNHRAYINGWLKRLNSDSKFIIKASSKAYNAFTALTSNDNITKVDKTESIKEPVLVS